MEGLFFIVQPIWWEGKISFLDIFGVCILILLITLLQIYIARYRNYIEQRKALPKFGEVIYYDGDDPDFSLKTLDSLKEIIQYFYLPKKSHSHTAREIGEYLFDSEIVEVGKKLEASIYTRKPLQKGECETINQQIRTFVQKSKKDFI